LCASYLAVLVVVLLLIDGAAFAYLAHTQHDTLEPILGSPEGRAVYDAALRRIALALALLDVPLLIAAGAASYVLAVVSVRPLVEAREREARFAAEAAHELRTPLARIASLAQSARGSADPAAGAAFARIAAVALDAAATVGDLLALVREERLAPKLSEPVDMAALARAAVAAANHDGVRYGVAAPDGDCWVVGDERRLRRLAENLLQNAGRHARTEVAVRVAREGDCIALSVEDDGAGVPPELRERVFERFVRAADDGEGSGLGLAICRTIARAHGGDVVLEARSRFVARIPRLDIGTT
jgi:signal transduction histidine kinase